MRYTLALDPSGRAAPLTPDERERLEAIDLDLVALGAKTPPDTLAAKILPELERCLTAEQTNAVWVVARVVAGAARIVPSELETRNPGRDARYCIASKLLRLRPEDLGDTAFVSFAGSRRAPGERPSGLPRGGVATVYPPRTNQTEVFFSDRDFAERRAAFDRRLAEQDALWDRMRLDGEPEPGDRAAPEMLGGKPLDQVVATDLERAFTSQNIAARIPGEPSHPEQVVVFVRQLSGGIAVVRRVTGPVSGLCTTGEGKDAILIDAPADECGYLVAALRAP